MLGPVWGGCTQGWGMYHGVSWGVSWALAGAAVASAPPTVKPSARKTAPSSRKAAISIFMTACPLAICVIADLLNIARICRNVMVKILKAVSYTIGGHAQRAGLCGPAPLAAFGDA